MRLFMLCMLLFAVSACSAIEIPNGASRWDFDHNVQFSQTQLSENEYHVEVVSKLDTEFSQLATFMMRHAYELCRSYGFTIEVLKGIEGVDDRKSFPNLIMSSLSANIRC